MGSGPIIGFYQAYDRLLLVDGDGTIRADFGRRLSSERIGSRRGSRPHPAGRGTRFALHDGLVYVGDGRRFEVETWTAEGRQTGLVRGPEIPLEVTDSVKRAFMELELQRVPEERRPALRASLAEWAWPESFPAFTELRVDPAGVIWAKQFHVDPDEPEVWSLLDTARAYLGDLTLPARRALLEAGEHHVLLLARDEVDVERVERWALRRSGDPTRRRP